MESRDELNESPLAAQGGSIIPAAVDEAEALALPVPGPESSPETGVGLLGLVTTEPNVVQQDGFKPPIPTDRVPLGAPPARPPFKRDQSVPPGPQHFPPPAPPAPPANMGEPGNPADSLTLMQLRRLVTEMPRVEPTPYAFEYRDASSFADEFEEWFSYKKEEHADILETHVEFREEWAAFCGGSGGVEQYGSSSDAEVRDWTAADIEQRTEFCHRVLLGLRQEDARLRHRALHALAYLALGSWHETAGVSGPDGSAVNETKRDGKKRAQESVGSIESRGESADNEVQISWIKGNVRLIILCDGIQAVYDAMRDSCMRASSFDDQETHDKRDLNRRELWCAMTIMYTILEVCHEEEDEKERLNMRNHICNLRPNPLLFMMDVMTKLRWDENIPLPLSKVLLITWKFFLICFGGISKVQEAKESFRDESLERSDKHGQPLITASPLDYHLFRQEISSKYPAYNPPPPLFPLEPENNSILPPLKNHPSKVAGSNVFGSGLAHMNGNATSILHQPVHIATPAPSPPPSPAGPGGKGGKKQNYQTNQLFPFLYPPLDESSNNLGGKGSTDLQDLLVGRKWTGSDIPTSILEAAELFADRMRATRAMKQLWHERVQFMKYERGWTGAEGDNDDVDELNISGLDLAATLQEKSASVPIKDLVPGSIEERLQLVENFYRDGLPQLQSLVIVLIRVVLSHVTALVTQAHNAQGFQYQDNMNGSTSALPDQSNGVSNTQGDGSTFVEDIEVVRTQEIMDKALSGILILLLKWFKVSHILKFEYLTQLLVDSSYIPLVLKFYQCQEIERVVNFKSDRLDLNFFAYCTSHSRQAKTESEQLAPEPEDEDSDDAAPPPIKRYRDPPTAVPQIEGDHGSQPLLPEVDELGFPTSELPAEPITNFSWRAFFTSINFLRIMQKICKNKAHRNLMLVSYKSSQCLRKSLKVPQPELRLYTLKLFKNQVPYCGRKWRSSNMRVITAVYLHCRPELRDDWLAGSDVDAEVDESVPLEQALRALTHWWNLRCYPKAMGATPGALEGEQDFFRKELEKMEWGDEAGLGVGVGADDGGHGEGPWDSQMEPW